MKKFKEYNEDACATAGNSNGMGNVVAANPSSTPGDVAGSTTGSGDIGQTLGTYTKTPLKLKKKKKVKKESRFYNFNSFINENAKKEKRVDDMSEDELKSENDKYIKLQNSFKLTPHDERRWKKISKKLNENILNILKNDEYKINFEKIGLGEWKWEVKKNKNKWYGTFRGYDLKISWDSKIPENKEEIENLIIKEIKDNFYPYADYIESHNRKYSYYGLTTRL